MLTKQGLPDLSKGIPDELRKRPEPPTPAPLKKRVALPDGPEDISDLLYLNDREIREEIKSWFPTAKLSVERYLDEERIGVEVRTMRLAWYRFLVQNGLSRYSLHFQLSLNAGKDENLVVIEAALDAERPGWRGRKK